MAPGLVILKAIGHEDIAAFKAVRLRALADSPSAFGSTYARESQFDEAEWMRRINRWNGERGIGYIAWEGDEPCGLGGCVFDDDDPTRVTLVSMWTAPTHRRRGVGRKIVKAVIDWARAKGAAVVDLDVTSNNEAARRLYEGLGFVATGRAWPYENDSTLHEIEMKKMSAFFP